jgi:hypothetical protein
MSLPGCLSVPAVAAPLAAAFSPLGHAMRCSTAGHLPCFPSFFPAPRRPLHLLPPRSRPQPQPPGGGCLQWREARSRRLFSLWRQHLGRLLKAALSLCARKGVTLTELALQALPAAARLPMAALSLHGWPERHLLAAPCSIAPALLPRVFSLTPCCSFSLTLSSAPLGNVLSFARCFAIRTMQGRTTADRELIAALRQLSTMPRRRIINTIPHLSLW